MTSLKTPWDAEKLSKEWISSRLFPLEESEAGKIIDLKKELISGGRGFSGEVWRLNLTYANDCTYPDSVVAKFSSKKAKTQKLIKRYAVNEVEVYRNKTISGNNKLFPKCFFAESNVDTHQVCILIEDLKTAHAPDNIAGITADEALIVTKGIAEFQANWWNNSEMKKLRWLRSPRVLSGRTNRLLNNAAGSFLEIYGCDISREFKQLVSSFPLKSKKVLFEISQPPITIGHGDFRPDNFFLKYNDSNSKLVVIDWQLASKLRGIIDISYLTAWGIPANTRSLYEKHMLIHYQETLTRNGILDYPMEKLKLDYRVGFLYALQVILIASFNLMGNTERERKLIKSVNERMDAIVQDHNLLKLLNEI